MHVFKPGMRKCEDIASRELHQLLFQAEVSSDKRFMDWVKMIYEPGLDTQLKRLQRFFVETEKEMDFNADWVIE